MIVRIHAVTGRVFPTLPERRRAVCDHVPPAGILRRIHHAEREIGESDEFDYKIVNDDIDKAVADVKNIITEIKKGA